MTIPGSGNNPQILIKCHRRFYAALFQQSDNRMIVVERNTRNFRN
jgi:hypothetical protein